MFEHWPDKLRLAADDLQLQQKSSRNFSTNNSSTFYSKSLFNSNLILSTILHISTTQPDSPDSLASPYFIRYWAEGCPFTACPNPPFPIEQQLNWPKSSCCYYFWS